VIPPTNAHGTKTAQRTRAMAMTGPVTSWTDRNPPIVPPDRPH
jgi:hypothetical protein